MILILGLLTFFYIFTILFLLFGFGKIQPPPKIFLDVKITFSIVVPYRNEEENLPRLLNSLKQLNYPPELFEVLLVNDASEDASAEICRAFKEAQPQLFIQLKEVRRKSASPKKDAISTAVETSRHQFILTTDADCSLPENWLPELNSFLHQTKAKMVAGPVQTKDTNRGLLSVFQELDNFSLQAATMGGFGVKFPFMCNGANLCYEKESFLKVNAFHGNDDIASGDDVFLLEKFRKAHLKTAFLKSRQAIVTTLAQPDWKSLFSQRIRWAAKTSALENSLGKGVGIVVFFMNFSLVLGLFAFFYAGLSGKIFFFLFLLKFNVDFLLLYRSAAFFEREKIMKNYWWSSAIYPFFSSSVAILSFFSGYTWKGRSFKK